jgi:hypothetical protein
MALSWTVLTDQHLVVVKGDGRVTRDDIDQYLAATIKSDAKAFAKLIELVPTSTLDLSCADLDHVVQSHVDYAKDGGVGPVAIVVHSSLNLDMAMLIKQRIGNRPYAIFVSMPEAVIWLRTIIASPPLYAAQVPRRQSHNSVSLAGRAARFMRQPGA